MGLGMERTGHPKSLRDALQRYVVMRRADAAGGEHIVELGAQLV